MHKFVQEAVRNLLFGLGFATLALASHTPQWDRLLTVLVVSGFVLIASACFVGIGDGRTPLGGGW